MDLKKFIQSTHILEERDLDEIISLIKDLKQLVTNYFPSEKEPSQSEYDKDFHSFYKSTMSKTMEIVENSDLTDLERRIALADSLANIFSILKLINEMDDLKYSELETNLYIELFVLFRAYDDIF